MMVSRRLIATCALIVTVAWAGRAGAQDGLTVLLQRLASHGHSRVTYVERQYLSVLTAPVESTGELVFEPPAHLVKRVLRPRPETMTIDSGMLSLERDGRRRTVPIASYPELGALIESIRATLAGDREALERHFSAELNEAAPRWTLTLVPRDARLSRIVQRICLYGHADFVDAVEIRKTNGDRSVMDITARQPDE